METADYVNCLRREGELLARAAEEAGTDAPVPSCPDWRVRDLVLHTGAVHRWATGFVAQGLTSPRRTDPPPELDGKELLDWFTEGHRQLTATLSSADPETDCWHFLPAPSPLAFWARRQAHETAAHRLDAEAARGGAPAGDDAESAARGIDEVLPGFRGRGAGALRAPQPRSLRVRATDLTGAVWTVRISQEPPVTVRDEPDAAVDCEVSGSAGQLYAALWNRAEFPSVTGDAGTATFWRENAGI